MSRPTIESYSHDEAEAAMCLWENALHRRIDDDDGLYDWLRGGEGAACARDMCLRLAADIELAYKTAVDEGFDDCFDWEFVPRWAEYAMEATMELRLGDAVNVDIGFAIAKEWKENGRVLHGEPTS